MSNRSWFFASQGQQQGPYPEAQLHEFIAKGMVGADTLVWTEGMANWQKAAEIPGLASPAPRACRRCHVREGRRPVSGACRYLGRRIVVARFRDLGVRLALAGLLDRGHLDHSAAVGPRHVLQVDRLLHARSGAAKSRLHRPAGRPSGVVLGRDCPHHRPRSDRNPIPQRGHDPDPVRAVLARDQVVRCEHQPPTGSRLAAFLGIILGYAGFNILAGLSVITIIGWAWVYTAQMRWVCRNIEGTQRIIVFKATGLQYLWRALVVVLACSFIIPIPWALRWIMRWHASQIELVDKAPYAGA